VVLKDAYAISGPRIRGFRLSFAVSKLSCHCVCDAEFKISSNGGSNGSKKLKRGYYDTYVGVWQTMILAGVWSQAVRFMWGRSAGI
jgi:hypothetical protein